VDTLPLDDAPETFGLSANADITLQQKETRDLMATLVSVQPRTGGGSGGRNPDDIVLELAVEIESKLPRPFSKDAAHPLTFATMADGSVNSLVSAILLPLFPLFFIPLRAPTRLCLRKRLLHALSPTLHPSVCGADSRRVPLCMCVCVCVCVCVCRCVCVYVPRGGVAGCLR
jgi:dynein heavy chain